MSSKNRLCLESSCRLCADLCNSDLDHILLEENKCVLDLIDKYLSIKVGTIYMTFNEYQFAMIMVLITFTFIESGQQHFTIGECIFHFIRQIENMLNVYITDSHFIHLNYYKNTLFKVND